jgi:hypothetical protein
MTNAESSELHAALTALLRELVHGAPADACYVLNPKDPGLLASLDRITAAAASAPAHGGGASIAAHVDHLKYGFNLMNRWAQGENPFGSSDFAASWKRGTVDDRAWSNLRTGLREEIDRWNRVIEQPRPMSSVELIGTISSVVHLAYHMGAMRQIDPALKGPAAPD